MAFQNPNNYFGSTPKMRKRSDIWGYKPLLASYEECCPDVAIPVCCKADVLDRRLAKTVSRVVNKSPIFRNTIN